MPVDMGLLDDIQRLRDEYLDLSESPENLRRMRCWEPEVVSRDQWHGRPRDNAFRFEDAVPVTVDLQNTFWLQLFHRNLADTFQQPLAYLRFFLERRVAQFELLPDDTPLDRVIPIYLGTPFEPALFGVPCEYYPDKDPIISAKPVVRDPADLDKLAPVDFHRSGLMPVAHRFYEEIRSAAGPAFTVVFPEWLRGPLGVAQYVRGYDDYLADLAGDAGFAAALLARLTAARMAWFQARAAFLGEPVPPGSLFNDEVDANVIGPRHYRALIRPHEEALARFHGRISYYHSCGNLGPFAREILSLDAIDMLDISAWTDLEQVLQAARAPLPRLEIRYHPMRDVLEASPAQVTARTARLLQLCRESGVGAATLRSSAIMPWGSPEECLAKVRLWLALVRQAAEKAGSSSR